MSRRKVLIFDDDSGVRLNWKDRLTAAPADFQVMTCGTEDMEGEIERLDRRRREFRDPTSKASSEKGLLDTVDILFVDYDLFELDETGENLAYLARCYSRCGPIVGVNRFGENPFDLTLKGHPDSFADLNIGWKQLDNPGLWSQPKASREADSFRPWVWPVLDELLESFEQRVQEALDHLDDEILTFFEFPPVLVEILPRPVAEFIAKKKAPANTTFRDFVEDSDNGLKRKDKTDDELLARIAAVRIGKWLERLVLAGQDLLVDAPHLVTRIPGLLGEHLGDPAAWNRTANLKTPGFEDAPIQDCRFEKAHWLSRPAWFWRKLTNSDVLNSLDTAWDEEVPDLVFCEDRSVFKERDEAREFVADVASPFTRRYVGVPQVEDVDYQPQVRFSL